MDNHLNRIHHFKGHPRAIGSAVGRALGPRLEQTISHYLAGLESSSDMAKLHEGALPWLRGLPQRFQGMVHFGASTGPQHLYKLLATDLVQDSRSEPHPLRTEERRGVVQGPTELRRQDSRAGSASRPIQG
jgi:hypothetical protein